MLRIAYGGGRRQLIEGALDPGEQRLIHGESAGSEAGKTDTVEGDVLLGRHHLAVRIGQDSVRCVEESAVAVLAQLLDAVSHGGFNPLIEGGGHQPVGRG
ncbi:hypothetical protein ACFY5F_28405 [Streptomyces sp. NPDC013161]|uniref:hypothetical protein n=1 Tax=Streptomyces sp. NPDC013161 TaxID=3364862 RepID=UPI003675037E